MLEPTDLRRLICVEIQRAFQKEIAAHRGHLPTVASQIGVKRQHLENYVNGSVPAADILLAALIRWNWLIRITDPNAAGGEPRWWECSMSAKDQAPTKKRPEPVQLPLFQAIDDLSDDRLGVKILRKGPGRLELAVNIAFADRAT